MCCPNCNLDPYKHQNIQCLWTLTCKSLTLQRSFFKSHFSWDAIWKWNLMYLSWLGKTLFILFPVQVFSWLFAWEPTPKKKSFEPFLKRIPLDTWILCKRRSWFYSSKLWERGRHIIVVTKRKKLNSKPLHRGAKKSVLCFSFPSINSKLLRSIFFLPHA